MARLSQVFTGKDRVFFDLFEEAAANVVRGADLLDQMLAHYPDRADLARDIVICEQEGDRITHDVHQRLNSTFVTPIDREDVLRLISDLDDIIDLIDEVADYLGLYKIEAPMEQSQRLAHVAPAGDAPDRRGDAAAALVRRRSRTTRSRSTAWRTRATASAATPSRRCSRRASTRWS